jgi:hypothetical protein
MNRVSKLNIKIIGNDQRCRSRKKLRWLRTYQGNQQNRRVWRSLTFPHQVLKTASSDDKTASFRRLRCEGPQSGFWAAMNQDENRSDQTLRRRRVGLADRLYASHQPQTEADRLSITDSKVAVATFSLFVADGNRID